MKTTDTTNWQVFWVPKNAAEIYLVMINIYHLWLDCHLTEAKGKGRLIQKNKNKDCETVNFCLMDIMGIYNFLRNLVISTVRVFRRWDLLKNLESEWSQKACLQ